MGSLHTYPTAASEVTAGWLTDRLIAAGEIVDGKVTAFDSSLVGEGAGLMSTVHRVTLTYEPGVDGPASVIAKFTTDSPGNRELGLSSAIYERETNFYRQVAPHGIVPAPRCFASEYDPVSGESVLLLEDLAGYREGDQVVGCTADQARTIIDTIVPLHLRYWGFRMTPELSWLWEVQSAKQSGAISGAVAALWEPCVARFGHLMSPELRAAGPRYVEQMPRLHQLMAQGPQTITHGDLRLDNMLFGTRPEHEAVVPIDWQALLVSNGVMDVAYLLSQNVTTEERRAHDRELIAHYHGRLVEGGVTGYGLDDCWRAYLLGSLYTLAYAVFTGGGLDPKTERGRRFMEAMVGRASDSVTELGALELLSP